MAPRRGTIEASWCGSAIGRDVIWRRAVSDWAGALVRAVTCSCDKVGETVLVINPGKTTQDLW